MYDTNVLCIEYWVALFTKPYVSEGRYRLVLAVSNEMNGFLEGPELREDDPQCYTGYVQLEYRWRGYQIPSNS